MRAGVIFRQPFCKNINGKANVFLCHINLNLIIQQKHENSYLLKNLYYLCTLFLIK